MKSRIAIAQIDVVCGDFDANFKKITRFIIEASRSAVDLLVFPELVDLGYELLYYSGKAQKNFVDCSDELEMMCRQLNITVLLGGARYEQGEVYNSLYIVSPEVSLSAVYSKNYLFIGESSIFKPSNQLNTINLNSYNAGFQICFDIRFPELLRSFDQIPEVVYVSAAWPLSRIEHWERLLVARAIENQCYIVASNRVGTDADLTFGGTSMVISPNGDILTKGSSNSEEIVDCTLDIGYVKSLRKSFPVLEHRKS